MSIALGRGRSAAAVLGPALLLLVPKCPLCLLPLLAALGVALPPTVVMNSAIALIAAGWSFLLLRLTHSSLLRVSGVIPAAGLIAGRVWSLPSATYVAVALMVLIGFVISQHCRVQKKGERCLLQSNEAGACSGGSRTTNPFPSP